MEHVATIPDEKIKVEQRSPNLLRGLFGATAEY
jgi:hypothetical protein